MPVRKVSNGGGNIIGKFPSIKMGRMIAFESLIERDFIYLLDYAAEVEWFEEQPLTIEYHHDGKVLHYTPDFHLIEEGQNVLVECKPEKFVLTVENQRKAAIASDWCKRHDWVYRVVTDEKIRKGFLLENVMLLTRYARQPVTLPMRRRICEELSNHLGGEISIGEVSSAISPKNPTVSVTAIMAMAFHHEITLFLEQAPISSQTLISLPLSTERGKEL